MPTKTFALEKGGPERLEVAWRGNFKDVEVRLDGVLLGSFDNAKALDAGASYALEDGSTLEVRRATTAGIIPELTLTRNGQPLPGTAADPEQRVAAAAGMIFFVAGFNALLGLAAVAFNITFLQSLGLAVGLFVLDGIALLASPSPPVGGLVARCFLLVPMVMGFPALRALQAEERRAAQRTPRPRPAPRAAAAAAAGAPSAARPASAPPPARTLHGDAERRRLELSQPQTTTTTRIQPSGRRVQTPTKTDVDSAEASLRFVARKCEVTPAGLKVSYPDGRSRDVAYPQIVSLVVRLLPPDPPWNAQPLLDAVVRSSDDTSWETVRVFSTTLVNTAALPGGGSTSRLENVRRLGSHLLSQHPALSLDPETAAFVKDGKPPARFVSTTHFAEYDQRYS